MASRAAEDTEDPAMGRQGGSLHVEGGQRLEDALNPPELNPEEAKLYRREFTVMSWTFAINHATVTTPIIYASSVLTNSAGQAGNAVLYGATLICSLFFSTVAFGVLGAKKGLSLAMGLYAVYVFLFAVSASMCAEADAKGACLQGHPLQLPTVLFGSAIGGLGAGILWTCQGAFFASVCERVAKAESRQTQAVTAEFAGSFALVFLAAESAVRASATLLTKYAALNYAVVFYLFSFLAAGSTLAFMILATSLKGSQASSGSFCGKALSAVRLWKDPKIWLLQCTNLTFGFAAAWLGGYVGRNILTKALNSDFIGFAGALLSALASVLSKLLGLLAQRVGKGPVVALGSISFILLGLLSRLVGDPAAWGWGVLIFYVLMGVGRAVYESTNKAIFADFFQGEKSAGAFANVFVFGTGASTLAFVLGATQQDLPELYLLITFAVLTLPGFLVASAMKRGEAQES
eukprot:gb/GFBE01057288.1/.p1 GENE.gb/GFBE01057288.1/~~gb/GFBE01057288.1/.p1  ORF type:complete len:462 (+),score=97.70 gb/GFBE01057288.1/:1-1386(+)